jgi:hypothetical protein
MLLTDAYNYKGYYNYYYTYFLLKWNMLRDGLIYGLHYNQCFPYDSRMRAKYHIPVLCCNGICCETVEYTDCMIINVFSTLSSRMWVK